MVAFMCPVSNFFVIAHYATLLLLDFPTAEHYLCSWPGCHGAFAMFPFPTMAQSMMLFKCRGFAAFYWYTQQPPGHQTGSSSKFLKRTKKKKKAHTRFALCSAFSEGKRAQTGAHSSGNGWSALRGI